MWLAFEIRPIGRYRLVAEKQNNLTKSFNWSYRYFGSNRWSLSQDEFFFIIKTLQTYVARDLARLRDKHPLVRSPKSICKCSTRPVRDIPEFQYHSDTHHAWLCRDDSHESHLFKPFRTFCGTQACDRREKVIKRNNHMKKYDRRTAIN